MPSLQIANAERCLSEGLCETSFYFKDQFRLRFVSRPGVVGQA